MTVLTLSEEENAFISIDENKFLQEEKIDEIKNQYFTDSLTKLQNRLKLIKDISSSQNLKLVLIDINSFKEDEMKSCKVLPY
ncbi:GGDEF domain-containing protein [Clostridium sp. DJ247]|uniref:GGDEF domain-containing protein n=1 Tax=Clostridium sp. DJ247 TaxID=2726188 RepID=UPI001629A900|nr:GGDEF domain-containing protein [Clostridium sp. DJ247]